MTRLYYRTKKDKPFLLIQEAEALPYNKEKWDIFRTVNSFHGNSKASAELKELLYWFVDIDSDEALNIPEQKAEMRQRLRKVPVFPTMVVESYRGYHLYWKASGATKENYRNIEEALIKLLDGDKKVKDWSRILRLPNTTQYKHKVAHFMKVCYHNSTPYTEEAMMMFLGVRQGGPIEEIKYRTYEGQESAREVFTGCGGLFPASTHRGVCPSEECVPSRDNPSLQFYEDTNTFHCFSCGTTGGPEQVRRLFGM